MRGAVSGFVTGLCLIAVFAFGATLVTRLPERLQPPVPIADPPVTVAAEPVPAPVVPQNVPPVGSAADNQPPKLALVQAIPAQRPQAPPQAPKPLVPAGLPVPEVGLIVDVPSKIDEIPGATLPAPTGDAPVRADRGSPAVAQPQAEAAVLAPTAPPVSAEPPELVATAPKGPMGLTPPAKASGAATAAADQPRPDTRQSQPDLAVASPQDSGISADARQPDQDGAIIEAPAGLTDSDTTLAEAEPSVGAAPDPTPDGNAGPDATETAAADRPAVAQEATPDPEPPVIAKDPVPEADPEPPVIAKDPAPEADPEPSVIAKDPAPEADPEPPVVAQNAAPEPAQPSPIVRNPVLDRDDSPPRIGTRVSNLIDRRDSVPVRRPDLTDATQATETRVSDDVLTYPLDQFRVPVAVDPGQGRLAIVLVHDGVGRTMPEAFAGFPFPLTIAVDPALGDAPEVMRAYRAQGIEVMALVDVPPATTRFDAELAVQAVLNSLPEVVGVMEGGADGIQQDRDVAEQVALLLQATGHGLLLRPSGLNTLEQFATREGVPTTTVFRDVDGSGQNDRAIQRFLDQAAFRARQGDGIVVQARVRPATLDALWVWALDGRASQTALVPISEILRPSLGNQ